VLRHPVNREKLDLDRLNLIMEVLAQFVVELYQ
jgi:hypothetical protein